MEKPSDYLFRIGKFSIKMIWMMNF
jgi:hypothetical protein